MKQPTILVTAATGKTGSAVVAQLRERGFPVRAVVRKADARSVRLERLGAETVVADLYDPEQLTAAIRGCARAYYCPPIQPYMIQASIAFATAAGEAKLESIVLMSQWLSSPSHPSLMTRQTWLTDQLFAMVPGLSLTIVNPGWFADNYLRMMYLAVHLGLMPVFPKSGRNAPPSNEDMARVIAAILINPDPHAGQTYRITGPASLTMAEMVEVIGRVTKRIVRSVRMPLWMLYKAGRLQGASAYELSSLRHYIEDHNQDGFGYGAPTDHVLRVTGQPAESFETTVQRYAGLPINQRTFGNFFRVLAEFFFVPIARGYDMTRFERKMNWPMPNRPRYAMQDEAWKAQHKVTSEQSAEPVMS